MLFDMDGTLVNSEPLWEETLHELAAEYGGTLSDAARFSMVGTDMVTSMTILHADLGQPWRDIAASGLRITELTERLFARGLPWRPGARELLAECRAAGLPLALVTSTERRLVEVALETLGRDTFAVVVCGDEVGGHTKPHPAPYLRAAELLGVDVTRCVAIEDSPAGVRSAVAAGAAVLGVPGDVVLAPELGATLAPSLTGVDLAFLRRLLAEDLAVQDGEPAVLGGRPRPPALG
ncbi:HAD family hydrolase [Allocatelliglobosispora scoriae]|uniref:HAD family hydrolase n=1 Tax=Allocatelliglobosispora scoriae TaxID=643052 RepID=UPI00160AB9F1|nr:HAD family phosphatase [Allocatelliglobosispora scoriae]